MTNNKNPQIYREKNEIKSMIRLNEWRFLIK